MSQGELNYTRFYPMEYYEDLAETFVDMAERVPTNTLETMYLTVAVIMFVAVMRCILTTGRRYFDSNRWFFKLQGWMLILLTCGQVTVAIAFMERSLRGQMDEWKLLYGVIAWLVGRYALQALSSCNKKLAQRKKKNGS